MLSPNMYIPEVIVPPIPEVIVPLIPEVIVPPIPEVIVPLFFLDECLQ